MKKTLSIFLSLIMLLSITAGIDLSACAATNKTVKNVTVSGLPEKYNSGFMPDLDDCVITVKYKNGSSEKYTLDMDDDNWRVGSYHMYYYTKDIKLKSGYEWGFSIQFNGSLGCGDAVFYIYIEDGTEDGYYKSFTIKESKKSALKSATIYNPVRKGVGESVLVKTANGKQQLIKVTKSTMVNLSCYMGYHKSTSSTAYTNYVQIIRTNFGLLPIGYDECYTYKSSFPESSNKVPSGAKLKSVSTYIFTDVIDWAEAKNYTIAESKISSLSATSKGFKVKYKKATKNVTGYQIQYATKKDYSNAKTVTVTKNSTTSKTISKLKSKKKYYVRVRTYKTVKVNGKSTKIYSSWSKSKTVTTKK